MRDIKFRGLAIDGNWVYGNYLEKIKPTEFIPTFWASFIHDRALTLNEVNRETIGQYTGFKDKNGQEIYEGDWLSVCAGYASVVCFEDGMFVSAYSHPEDSETIPLGDAIGDDTIVVGNIHEKN